MLISEIAVDQPVPAQKSLELLEQYNLLLAVMLTFGRPNLQFDLYIWPSSRRDSPAVVEKDASVVGSDFQDSTQLLPTDCFYSQVGLH
ncbi:unnamed protein product [Protopolystoma xenopodis]|uniref:Uncharacterized protein n=1 Tax=Protopolystoma xenopodis TaxID=117903 RepID=A0A3S5AIK8_9PLAT|nr:unnamed protein product [Protopolystoma xenopodis]